MTEMFSMTMISAFRKCHRSALFLSAQGTTTNVHAELHTETCQHMVKAGDIAKYNHSYMIYGYSYDQQ